MPFVCIPAGTRNHFALDLGVDREDVVGALDAFTDGYERRVDLARVNGRVFVNNVSFGVYAAIVQSDEYRDAKLNTAAKMLPELLGSDYDPFDFELDGPDAVADCDPDLILVSNNVYKLEGIGGLGTRAAPRRGRARRDRRGGAQRRRSSRSSSRCRPPVGARRTRDGTSGARPRSRCGRASRSTPASTARRSPSTPRCGSRCSRARCACGSRHIIPACRRPGRRRGAGGGAAAPRPAPRSAPDAARATAARPARLAG